MQPDAGDASPAPIWVSLRRDSGPCASAPDCGWFVRVLNEHEAEEHVDRVDLTGAALGAADREVVTEALDRAVVLRGRLEGSSFVADQACRALPLEAPPRGGSFVQVRERPPNHCITAVCPPSHATLLNLDLEVPIRAVDLSPATARGVDTDWLENRVFERGSVLGGRFVTGRRNRVDSFVADQIFIPLPDRTTPCPTTRQTCSAGSVPVYRRDVDRCLIPLGCRAPERCHEQPPDCAPGYVLRSWRSAPSGCSDFACDLAFLRERGSDRTEP